MAKRLKELSARPIPPFTLSSDKWVDSDDRRAAGKQLRDKVPRNVHAGWRPHVGRADPLSILQAADVTRQQRLIPLRYGRMLQSPFAFYRGSAGVMASDLSATAVTGIHVQACGDAHLMNFGVFATPERSTTRSTRRARQKLRIKSAIALLRYSPTCAGTSGAGLFSLASTI